MNGFWVTVSNIGGVISNDFVKTEVMANEAIAEFACNTGFYDGDTIEVKQGWSEEVE